MLHSIDIINSMKENNARINELENMVRELRGFYRGCDPKDILKRKDEIKERGKLEAEYHNEIEERKILSGILRDNARRAFFTESMPAILEILTKYQGKPIGEKTREKIAEEAMEKIGHRIYLENEPYSTGRICISWCDYTFRYDDFKICLNNGNNKMFDGNKLVVYPVEDYVLYYCGEYVDDPEGRAKKIQENFAELKRMESNFQKACSEFNHLIPSSMENVYPNNFRSYLF